MSRAATTLLVLSTVLFAQTPKNRAPYPNEQWVLSLTAPISRLGKGGQRKVDVVTVKSMGKL